MFQPNPPTPRAMSDDELNAKIAEVQLQPDGLVAAMALIEEQSRLRQEDALAYSQWQLESQMHAATAGTISEPELLEDPANLSPTNNPEPIIDIFANVAPVAAPMAPSDSEPSQEQPGVSQQIPAPTENIEDIVAALNASYAEVATEPEVQIEQEPEFTVEFSETVTVSESESGIETVAISETVSFSETVATSDKEPENEILPQPVGAAVDQGESVTQSETQSKTAVEDLDEIPASSKSSALSWSWLAIASTPLTLILAAFLKESGASFAQAVVLLAGVLIGTSLLSSVGSVASARGASSLTVISRAAFGVWGNAVPAVLVLIAKLLWAAVLVYFAARIISPLVSNQPWFANIASALVFPADFTAMVFTAIPLLIIAGVMAGLGKIVMLRFQQVAAVISLLGVVAFGIFVLTSYSLQDLDTGIAISGGSLVDLAVLALAVFGFATFSVAGDFAKNLPVETPSAKVFFLSFVSTFFIPFLVGGLGLMWLYMAQDTLESSFTTQALATVAAAAPMWVFVMFAVAIGVSVLYLIATSLYSLSLNRIGLARIQEWVAQFGAGVKVAVALLVPSYLVAVSVLQESIIELLLIAAVVAAAWAGIVVSDALIRSRGYHEVSLTREYGFYGKANATNLVGFVFAIAVGLGYLDGGPQLSFWAGYLGDLTPEIFEVAGSNIGIAMAFGLALLFPVFFGIPRIRKQEQNLSELDLRRQELKEFLDSSQ